MTDIKLENLPAEDGTEKFLVVLTDDVSATRHEVSVGPEDKRRLAGVRLAGADLVRRSFEFLLAREPKESILPRFDLAVIGRYYPEYFKEMASI